jgi:hypothetical protein
VLPFLRRQWAHSRQAAGREQKMKEIEADPLLRIGMTGALFFTGR